MTPWPVYSLESILADPKSGLMDGPFGSKLKSEHYTPSGVRVIRLGNIGVGEFKHGDKSYIDTSHASMLTRHAVAPGDLVISALAEPVGRCCEIPRSVLPAIVKADCVRFRPREDINRRFIMHWLNSPEARKNAEARSHGVGRLRINLAEIRELSIPVPPRAIQDAVVAAIEEHWSKLDIAVASLSRAKTNVKRAKASMLKAAVEGRLVPTEAALALAKGQDYEPASSLLARIIPERRHRWTATGATGKYKEPLSPELDGGMELPPGWVWASMDQMLDSIETGKSFAAEGTPPNPDQVGIMKVSAVTWGHYDEMESKTVHEPSQINPAYFVHPGDLLFSRANTIDLVGAVVIVEYVTRRIMLSDKILRLRMPDRFKRWVQWVLRSQHGRQQIELLATGNQESMRNIGQERIRRIIIPVPPLAEQQRIVAEVDRRLSVLDALDATLNANLARCARLRQSILKRAFEGRLVPPGAPDTGAPQLPLFTEEATR